MSFSALISYSDPPSDDDASADRLDFFFLRRTGRGLERGFLRLPFFLGRATVDLGLLPEDLRLLRGGERRGETCDTHLVYFFKLKLTPPECQGAV